MPIGGSTVICNLTILFVFPDDLTTITLSDILAFATGHERIPPMGFRIQPMVESSDNDLPTASTCSYVLRLSKFNPNYAVFRENMEYGISHGLMYFGVP